MLYPFLMIHGLTEVALSNPNRNQDGRPKSMKLNETTRTYLSSQNRKYDLTQNLLKRYGVDLGEQTPMIGRYIANKLIKGGIEESLAEQYATKFIGTFVNLKKHDKDTINNEDSKSKKAKKKKTDFLKTETIKIQPSERDHIEELIQKIIKGYAPQDDEFHFLKKNTAVRTALTGRMIAKEPSFDVEASLSSNFPFTVNETPIQIDYFTAMDSLQIEGSKGSGHLDNFHYSQGVYYSFIIIEINLLIKNLCDNKELALTTVNQILNVLATSSPSANKNRCADGLTWPTYLLIEKAEVAPRSLCSAFHTPISGPNIMEKAIGALRTMKGNFDHCYGEIEAKEMNVLERLGSLEELLTFVKF